MYNGRAAPCRQLHPFRIFTKFIQICLAKDVEIIFPRNGLCRDCLQWNQNPFSSQGERQAAKQSNSESDQLLTEM